MVRSSLGRWRPGSGSRSASPTWWAGSAARSSPCCCRAPTAPARTGIAERLRANAATLSVAAADARINVTVSIGVAVLGQHGNDLFELLAAADVALYRAKDAGRDQVRIYAHATGNATENKDEATDACP